jgi:hypothetical protein
MSSSGSCFLSRRLLTPASPGTAMPARCATGSHQRHEVAETLPGASFVLRRFWNRASIGATQKPHRAGHLTGAGPWWRCAPQGVLLAEREPPSAASGCRGSAATGRASRPANAGAPGTPLRTGWPYLEDRNPAMTTWSQSRKPAGRDAAHQGAAADEALPARAPVLMVRRRRAGGATARALRRCPHAERSQSCRPDRRRASVPSSCWPTNVSSWSLAVCRRTPAPSAARARPDRSRFRHSPWLPGLQDPDSTRLPIPVTCAAPGAQPSTRSSPLRDRHIDGTRPRF